MLCFPMACTHLTVHFGFVCLRHRVSILRKIFERVTRSERIHVHVFLMVCKMAYFSIYGVILFKLLFYFCSHITNTSLEMWFYITGEIGVIPDSIYSIKASNICFSLFLLGISYTYFFDLQSCAIWPVPPHREQIMVFVMMVWACCNCFSFL